MNFIFVISMVFVMAVGIMSTSIEVAEPIAAVPENNESIDPASQPDSNSDKLVRNARGFGFGGVSVAVGPGFGYGYGGYPGYYGGGYPVYYGGGYGGYPYYGGGYAYPVYYGGYYGRRHRYWG